jgi:hypothetical protein
LFVIPSAKQRDEALVVEALVSMSSVDLESLREMVVLQNAGAVVEEIPERAAVVLRWKASYEAAKVALPRTWTEE